MLRQIDKEGYFLLDHSQTIGFSDEVAVKAGLPPGAGHGLFEAPTYTCSHCQTICVVRMPRNIEVPYCSGCDHYICGTCGKRRGAGAKCRTFRQIMDEAMQAGSLNSI